ncbi:MAG TPA: hypothetical protein VFS43_27935 [Polyangiaceae bacterium]|nr:hypothetical protein [Polyangiaceae bacterium]
MFVLLQQADAPTVLERDARAAWGDETVEALLRAGAVRRDAATWYPCGGPRRFGCPRRVRPNAGDRARPLLAVCGQEVPACRPVPLTRREASPLLLSLTGLGRAVRRLLALEGELAPDDASMPGTLRLGHREEGGGLRDVLLTRAAWDAGFGAMLAERAAHARPALVLAPTATHVRSDLVARYAGPGRVQLAFLEDLLAVRGGELVLAGALEPPVAPAAEAPFCRALTDGGELALDRKAYEALRSSDPPPFDLVLDLIHVAHGRPAEAWSRDAGGHVELTRHEAEALVELVERAVPTEARELACLRAARLHDPVRVVERARRKVDARVSRYEWRTFVTSGGSGETRAFHFTPPEGFRYACLVPHSR